jgi:hypothetical protein
MRRLSRSEDGTTRLFDVYIAVDWSSSNSRSPARPTENAIWVGERVVAGSPDPISSSETYFRTRMECRSHLRNQLLHHARYGRRVFVGFDFAYGYPAGLATALGLDSAVPPWRAVWDELTRLVTDRDDNSNNRFEVAAQLNARCGDPKPGPFWGCPQRREQSTLSMRSPGYPYEVRSNLRLERLRRVDKAQRGVQEVWKLYGAGSVGGQALVGIPAVRELRDDADLASFSRVWPFETGFAPTPSRELGPSVLHVEIFPGNVPEPLDSDVTIRDQAQVRAVVRWISRLDAGGQLGALFAAPDGLSPEELEACAQEEGWIIGSRRER